MNAATWVICLIGAGREVFQCLSDGLAGGCLQASRSRSHAAGRQRWYARPRDGVNPLPEAACLGSVESTRSSFQGHPDRTCPWPCVCQQWLTSHLLHDMFVSAYTQAAPQTQMHPEPLMGEPVFVPILLEYIHELA